MRVLLCLLTYVHVIVLVFILCYFFWFCFFERFFLGGVVCFLLLTRIFLNYLHLLGNSLNLLLICNKFII